MGNLRALAIAGAITIGATHWVLAADLLPPPPPLAEPAAEPSDSGWYLRGDVGVGITSLSSVKSTFANGGVTGNNFVQKDLSDQAVIGLGVGYQFNDWLRFDVTGEYRGGSRYSALESYVNPVAPPPTGYDTYSGNLRQAVFLANGYVDLGTWNSITPYVGVGIGGSYNMISGLTDNGVVPGGGFGFAPNHNSFAPAWALMAGLDYSVNSHLKLELGYRYLNTGTATTGAIVCQNTVFCPLETQKLHTASSDIRLGMRWMFGEEAEAPPMVEEPVPQEPLVRKILRAANLVPKKIDL